ncbi:MAG: zinc dependent phospholipase C family protein [Firmicutes bacterium]|nr:zinc dependent phospholipase C family protein [Bacillota bacterium]
MRRLASTLGFVGKYLLATCRVSLTTRLGFCATHIMCNNQARLILKNDGHVAAARMLETFRRELDLGVCWPDSGWGSLHHFYHARTGAGLMGMRAADVFYGRYYQLALDYWRRGRFRKAMFFLGAVTHLLQDICEPHHTNCSWGLGHCHYEKWVQENKDVYLVNSGGIYSAQPDPLNWLKECAGSSFGLFELVDENTCNDYFRQATGHLLPLTQRVTAGFWLDFLTRAEILTSTRPVFKSQPLAASLATLPIMGLERAAIE